MSYRVIWLTMTLGALIAHSGALLGSVATHSSGMMSGVGIERGVTRVMCAQQNSKGWRRSRAIILDTGKSGLAHDVLLAPAHGLPQESELIKSDCKIVGAHGSTVRIADFWLPGDRGGANAGDWAVLLTSSVLQGEVGRLHAGVLVEDSLERLVNDEAPVRLLLYSASVEQEGCRMLNEDPWSARQYGAGVFFHSCRVWPGISGAPMVAGVDGQAVVIGFNIGHRLRISGSQRPRSMGVARVIDHEIAAAIRQATERARGSGDSSRRRSRGGR